MKKLIDYIRALTTLRDNKTPDGIRIFALLMMLQFVGNSAWALFGLGQSWDATNYGTGASLLLAGIGAALLLKEPTEPKA